ncbi:MAG: HAD hydrolase-like protein [Spirochaetales bacterium]|nr:HAD hydrolase-like protein [Spirochaetales bacterium]
MKYIIWDWNGTLFNDVAVCIAAMNELLEKYELPLLQSEEEYRSKFTFPVIDYYRAVGFDFEKTPFDLLAGEFIETYHRLSRECPLSDGVEELLSELKRKGYRQIILSASKRENLLKQLEAFDIDSHFEEILGLTHIYAESKVDLARDWIGRSGAKSLTVIGDTLHDYEVAREIGADCLLYSRGHQELNGAGEYRVIDRFESVINLL